MRCKVPETLRIEIDGALRDGVTAKDVVLHLLQMDAIRSGGAIGLVFEYGGAAELMEMGGEVHIARIRELFGPEAYDAR